MGQRVTSPMFVFSLQELLAIINLISVSKELSYFPFIDTALYFLHWCILYRLPRWFSGKESTCGGHMEVILKEVNLQCRRHGFSLWVKKIPEGGNGFLILVGLPEKSCGQCSLSIWPLYLQVNRSLRTTWALWPTMSGSGPTHHPSWAEWFNTSSGTPGPCNQAPGSNSAHQ